VRPTGSTARERRLIDGLVRRAIATDAPLLARDLSRYAAAEGMSWEALARQLGGTPDGLNRVALCRPPRPERFAEDAKTIAAGHVDADRLLALLRRIQVLGAFHGFPEATARQGDRRDEARGVLLAARDHEEGEEAAPEAEDTAPGEEPGPETGGEE
jgi:hypothetical protein